MLNNITNDQVVAVCFNIFETLLIKPYVKFQDPVTHLGMSMLNQEFPQKRMDAEKKARAKIEQGEAYLDEIYNELSFSYRQFMKDELKLVKQTLIVNPEILEVVEFAKSLGKRVVFISD